MHAFKQSLFPTECTNFDVVFVVCEDVGIVHFISNSANTEYIKSLVYLLRKVYYVLFT